MTWNPIFTFSVTWDNVGDKPATATRWPDFSEVSGSLAVEQVPNLSATYVTTASDQADLSGNKSWTGEHSFKEPISIADVTHVGSVDIEGTLCATYHTKSTSTPLIVFDGDSYPTSSALMLFGGGLGIQFVAQSSTPSSLAMQGGAAALSASSLLTLLGQDIALGTTLVRPTQDNRVTLGSAALRWGEVFAVNGTINTSDARHKTSPREMSPEELAAAIDIAKLPRVFQWLSAMEEKGSSARLHIGPTVQDVISAMESHGLDPFRYGFVCYDEWPPVGEVTATRLVPGSGFEEGVLQETVPAGDVYSLRPTELANFVMCGLVHRQDEIERRLKALEATEV